MANDDLQGILDKVATAKAVAGKLSKEDAEKLIKEALDPVKNELYKEAKALSEESFDNLREKLEKDRLNVIQVTSIITLFIGFIAVDFGILKNVSEPVKAAGLTLMLLGSIGIFALLIDLLSQEFKIKKIKTTGRPIRLILPGTVIKEEVDPTLNPQTWGLGLQIRGILLLLSIIFLSVGCYLIAR